MRSKELLSLLSTISLASASMEQSTAASSRSTSKPISLSISRPQPLVIASTRRTTASLEMSPSVIISDKRRKKWLVVDVLRSSVKRRSKENVKRMSAGYARRMNARDKRCTIVTPIRSLHRAHLLQLLLAHQQPHLLQLLLAHQQPHPSLTMTRKGPSTRQRKPKRLKKRKPTTPGKLKRKRLMTPKRLKKRKRMTPGKLKRERLKLKKRKPMTPGKLKRERHMTPRKLKKRRRMMQSTQPITVVPPLLPPLRLQVAQPHLLQLLPLPLPSHLLHLLQPPQVVHQPQQLSLMTLKRRLSTRQRRRKRLKKRKPMTPRKLKRRRHMMRRRLLSMAALPPRLLQPLLHHLHLLPQPLPVARIRKRTTMTSTMR